MKSVEQLKMDYQMIEKRVLTFIIEHSGVEYIKESEEVVEGGAFAWASLSSEDETLQTQLRMDYLMLAESARQRLERSESRHLSDFDRSRSAVLSYIRQDSLLWMQSLEAVAEAAKIEFDLQKYLITQA